MIEDCQADQVKALAINSNGQCFVPRTNQLLLVSTLILGMHRKKKQMKQFSRLCLNIHAC